MDLPQVDPIIAQKLDPSTLTWDPVMGEWVTKIGHHRLVEMVVAFFSGYRYQLNPYWGNDYRIETIFKRFSHIRKSSQTKPYQHSQLILEWSDLAYWFQEGDGDVLMLTQK